MSTFVAVQQALLAWTELPAGTSPTFIHTGNILNVKPMGAILDLTIGKSGTASLVQVAAEAYAEKKYKFYYADQRGEDGSPMAAGVDGPGHANLYYELAQGDSQGEWHQTFVAGKGYTKF